MKEETDEAKDGGASGNIQELECVDGCPGCCGVPIQDQVDPTEDKEPLDGG